MGCAASSVRHLIGKRAHAALMPWTAPQANSGKCATHSTRLAGRRRLQWWIAAAPMAGGAEVMDVAGASIDLAGVSTAQKVILVEGGSDKAALEALAVRRDQVLGRG